MTDSDDEEDSDEENLIGIDGHSMAEIYLAA